MFSGLRFCYIFERITYNYIVLHIMAYVSFCRIHVNFIRVTGPIPLEKTAIAKQFGNDSSFYVCIRQTLIKYSISSYVMSSICYVRLLIMYLIFYQESPLSSFSKILEKQKKTSRLITRYKQKTIGVIISTLRETWRESK